MYLCFFLDLLVFMICSVNSHATPPPALGTSSCFFYLACHMLPLSQGFPCFCSRSPPSLVPRDSAKKMVGILHACWYYRPFPCCKGFPLWQGLPETLKFFIEIVTKKPPNQINIQINIFGKKNQYLNQYFLMKKRKISIL